MFWFGQLAGYEYDGLCRWYGICESLVFLCIVRNLS
jgi:hypothetical protein